MSILSDRTIREYLAAGTLEITPLGEGAVRPASVDLRLGPTLLVRDPNAPNGWREHDLRESPFRLFPGMLVLGATLERVRLPSDLAGVVAGKSSRAREGLIVESAGYVDPSWYGDLTVEMTKLGPDYLLLELGMPICQIRFETLTTAAELPYGSDQTSHYQGSRGPVPSRAEVR